VVVPRFDLGAADTWDATRETHRRWIDAVAKHDGWSIYLTTGAVWEQVLDTLARAIAPSVEYARDKGVRLAFEPSLRTEVSFVTSLRDAIDVADRTELGIVADIGNFWMERDLRATLLRAAPRLALVHRRAFRPVRRVRGLHGAPSRNAVEQLPDDIPAQELTVWEPLAIAVRWATAVKPGDSVAILGPGHLGLASIVAARAAGAERIFITGTASDALRLEAARTLGVEEAVDISATDPLERLRELTGDGVDVVIDAASASTSTVTQGMQMAKRGGTVVIGGLKDRKPVPGFISDWIPMRQLHLHAGFPGDHVKTAIELIRQGKVPTADLLGEAVTMDGLGEALRLLAREAPGRDAIRLALRLTD
jgi:hypothetical protein